MKSARLGAFACGMALLVSGVAAPAPVPPDAKDSPKVELARLTGRWKVVSHVRAGVELIEGQNNPREMIAWFKKDGTFGWASLEGDLGKIARIDPSKSPKEIDYLFTEGTFKDKTQKGLYKLDGDTYTDCCSEPGGDRPTEFKSTAENKYDIMVFKRVKNDD